jgi:uncharacterized membrane protein YeaQ/YmgE (transglycosylase-associated protein family)
MLELYGWEVGMNLGEAILLIFGAIVIAAVAQYIGRVSFGYEWVFTGIAALVGGWLGSEAFGTLSTWGPAFEGLYILPALIGALVLGGIVDGVVRFSSGGTYLVPRPV